MRLAGVSTNGYCNSRGRTFRLSDASEDPSNIYDPRDMQARALTCHHIDSHKQLNERCCEGQPQP